MSQIGCCGGHIDKGTPDGEIKTVAGVKCYQSKIEPSNTDTLIVIATDIFGYTLPNVRLIADKFANETGILCIVPDLFQGD